VTIKEEPSSVDSINNPASNPNRHGVVTSMAPSEAPVISANIQPEDVKPDLSAVDPTIHEALPDESNTRGVHLSNDFRPKIQMFMSKYIPCERCPLHSDFLSSYFTQWWTGKKQIHIPYSEVATFSLQVHSLPGSARPRALSQFIKYLKPRNLMGELMKPLFCWRFDNE
jgi:hypothetical protein